MRDMDASLEKMDATRKELIGLFIENNVDPQEALSLLSGMLIQIYFDMVENNSRDNFTNVMAQCYDAYHLMESEPEGTIQ